jgi:hypothetical protein
VTGARDRLRALAPHLPTDVADEIVRLTEADSEASQLLDAQARAQRAEDLARECKRQLRSRNRQCDELEAQLAARPLVEPGPCPSQSDIVVGGWEATFGCTLRAGHAGLHLHQQPGAAEFAVWSDEDGS